MTVLRKFWWISLLWCGGLSVHAQTSVLHTGDWFKMAVEKNGVYRISYDLLVKMGLHPDKINPQHIKIFGLEGGMLPQPNSIARPSDLLEIAIEVTGEGDGRFDKGDFVLFYAEGADEFEYDGTRDIFFYENNLYSDVNYYFLTIGTDAGKRISARQSISGSFPVITSFNDFAFYEHDQHNIERSGREWFGEKFGTVNSHTISFNIGGIQSGSGIKLVSHVMGQSYTEASFRLHINNVSIADQKISPIPNARYSVKGFQRADTIVVNADDVNAANRTSHDLKYEFLKGTGFSQGFLNFILLNVTRELALYGDQTTFVSGESLSQPISTFSIEGVGSGIKIWNVTDHYQVRSQEFSLSGSAATFSDSTDQIAKWIVFSKPADAVFVSKISNQNLSGLAAPDLLIITHPDFLEEAQRLADHRENHNNWSVVVVTIDEIYHQFSSGRQDVTALRDFIKLLKNKNPQAMAAVLLFGRGSYDYKDRLPNNTNFVPTYQSRNSLHPLQTYSSDDYFAFLETGEGTWNESPAQHHTLDLGVGRLPVTSKEQARTIVDKIIHYETNQTYGAWRKKIIFVADDGNSEDNFTSLHQYQADQLATSIEENHPALDTKRIFMGSYRKNVQPNGETVPDMADDIKRSFDQGALIINFTGHGSEEVWADERILTEKTIDDLNNDRYPFLVTATCEFGRQDDPLLISTAERSLTRRAGGSIGLVTTARPVNATTNFDLNEAFYDALLEHTANGYPTIGDVFLKTKNNSTSGVGNRNFALIGDPSMTLALPRYSIQVTSIKTALGSDTLKALSTVTVKAAIYDPDGTKSDFFNGIAEATLYDKEKEFVTIGKNNPPFEYRQWDNAVFRGTATVKDGEFGFVFVMPKNIAYQTGAGKFSFYAFDPEAGVDAKGVNTALRIGGSEKNVIGDTTPPTIRLFIGDTTFVNEGITTPDTYLIAKLEDENGINISGYGIGNSIIAQLDQDAATYVLNDYYISSLDTYKKGVIRFPLIGLTPGRHQLTVKAWDVHNNPSEASIGFFVTDGEELVIETFANFPNPFRENSTLFFTHNRSGDDLEAQVFIYTPAGELIKTVDFSLPGSEYHNNLIELGALNDSGKKLSPGLYLARLVVRSMTNSSKNEKVTKLIVLN